MSHTYKYKQAILYISYITPLPSLIPCNNMYKFDIQDAYELQKDGYVRLKTVRSYFTKLKNYDSYDVLIYITKFVML